MTHIISNPRGTSLECFRCGENIAPMDKACPKCGLDRHVNACINILKMCGASAYRENAEREIKNDYGKWNKKKPHPLKREGGHKEGVQHLTTKN